MRICHEKTEGKEVKRVEMLQYKENMNNKTNWREKHAVALIMAPLGKTSNTANPAREKWRKNKWRKRRREELCDSFTSAQSNKLIESALGNSLLSSN